MRKILQHIIYILIAFISFQTVAQNNKIKGYRIEGNSVVFTFDKRDYKKATDEYHNRRLDFEDLDIENVVVSGEFNDWAKDKWQMYKVDEYIYELRKNIQDFTDEFSWEFKFVINNAYWAEPNRKDANATSANKYGLNLNGIYNLKMYTAYPDKNGNAHFKLKGYNDAKRVIIAGSFNKWHEHLFKMNKVDDGWELTLQIKPGVHQYRFIVDGNWMEDPSNIHKVINEYGGHNSVLDIKKYTAFKLRGFTDAQRVVLAGSFNNWNEQDFVMEKMDYGWKFVVPLSGGKHHYKFIVDGEWVTDPNNSIREYDDEGNVNSVCMVK